MDDTAQIDLALNTDFDSSLFDCWDDDAVGVDRTGSRIGSDNGLDLQVLDGNSGNINRDNGYADTATKKNKGDVDNNDSGEDSSCSGDDNDDDIDCNRYAGAGASTTINCNDELQKLSPYLTGTGGQSGCRMAGQQRKDGSLVTGNVFAKQQHQHQQHTSQMQSSILPKPPVPVIDKNLVTMPNQNQPVRQSTQIHSQQHHQLHPLGIQSSATCPLPHHLHQQQQQQTQRLLPNCFAQPQPMQQQMQTKNFQQELQYNHQQQQISQNQLGQSYAVPVGGVTAQDVQQQQQQQQEQHQLFPLPFNAVLAGGNSFQNPMAYYLLSQQQQQQQQQQTPNHVAVVSATSTMQQQQQQQTSTATTSTRSLSPCRSSHTTRNSIGKCNDNLNRKGNCSNRNRDGASTIVTATSSTKATKKQPPSSVTHGVNNKSTTSATSTATAGGEVPASDLPPFLLFDAPIELRANFIQSQRQHGIVPMQDNNAIHYGMVVNGFHPQQQQQQQQQVPVQLLLQQPPAHNLQTPLNQSTFLMDGGNSVSMSRGNVTNTSGSSASGNNNDNHSDNQNNNHHHHHHSHQPQVRLIDGRHGTVGNKRVKNAREQKRTQKITDLIDELRVKMERGGWKVGLKSKFHTLASCAEYVKHLVQINVDKEEALKKARADLEEKRHQIEEDVKSQQDSSDPESTTSSLTVSTSSDASLKRPPSGDKGCGHSATIGSKKRSMNDISASAAPTGSNNDSHQSNDANGSTHDTPSQKMNVLNSHGSSLSSSTVGEGCGQGHDQKKQCRGQSGAGNMVSSVSDVTDSNNGGSSKGNCSSSSQPSSNDENNPKEDQNKCSDNYSGDGGDDCGVGVGGSVGGTGSVSSDAAVARGQDNHGHTTSHADVVVTRIRKRKNPRTDDDNDNDNDRNAFACGTRIKTDDELTSLEKSFQLDYEEVFLRSNVPQILATTSGRIVAWNDFFLKITGLKPKEVERLTFFSFVQPDRLSNLFDIVAAALRSGKTAVQPNNEGDPATRTAINNDEPFQRESTTVSGTSSSGGGTSVAAIDSIVHEESKNIKEKKRNDLLWNCAAITLPCVSFETSDNYDCNTTSSINTNNSKKLRHESSSSSQYTTTEPNTTTTAQERNELHQYPEDQQSTAILSNSDDKKKIRQLYITVTLMSDDDPKKRCFHCVFTDCPGTNGALGSVTPELLSTLFTKQNMTMSRQ